MLKRFKLKFLSLFPTPFIINSGKLMKFWVTHIDA